VWSDRVGFEKAADNFVETADKLAQLAKAGDADAVAAQVKVVTDACANCHNSFRAK